jgi:prevent-host-death family protein
MVISVLAMPSKVAAGEFKAKCLRILDEVHQSRKPVLITKRGKVVARLLPPEEDEQSQVFGRMKGTGVIVGDIVSAVGVKWDADE